MVQLFPFILAPLVLAFALGFLMTLVWAVYGVVHGMAPRTSFGPLAIVGAAYATLLFLGSAVSKERRVPLGTRLCFDDWCATVTHVRNAPPAAGNVRTVTAAVRVSSDAKRVTQRGSDPHVYFIDDRGTWYTGHIPQGALPFDHAIGPGESYETRVEAEVPSVSTIVAIRVWEGGWIDRLAPFDEESPFHRKTFYAVNVP
jgi:hypothetical protein